MAANTETDVEKNDKAEDTEGNDTPEMSWSYNHRLVNPYKSLSKDVRRIISNIPMRDPNDMRKKLKDSIGQTKFWNAEYIYSSIMSRMAKMSLGEINNFVVVKPVEELSEKERKQYPIGKPSFPVLEGMKTRYPWANDLIAKLRGYYTLGDDVKFLDMTSEQVFKDPIAISEIGNVVSQFYTNFCQQYTPYCIMVNGEIINENQPTGAASLRQTAITNYEGNMRFKGIDMIYNADGSANHDNVAKNREKIAALANIVSGNDSKEEFWDGFNDIRKKYDDGSLYDMFGDKALPGNIKQFCKDTVDVLKACGMVFTDFDIFCILAENKDPGIVTLLSELDTALFSIQGLPANEHIFESSMNIDVQDEKGRNYEKPNFYWNKFFEKFGDYVTENEYESSFRTMGKSMYSYTYPSYMSMTISNLTNPDPEARKKYIEENFMPYDWFYDKEKHEFRNVILGELYEGSFDKWAASYGRGVKANDLFGVGHDIICKKDGYNEKDYADWNPEDILQIMFRELTWPTNKRAGGFIIPVLSDSRVCKVIQAEKADSGKCIGGMIKVVMQELNRMNLVEKRNIILRMQDIQYKIDTKQTPKSEEKEYYNKHRAFFLKYKEQHPELLQEVENFDKNGSKFCFFPELNDYKISVTRSSRENDSFMFNLIRVLSKNMDSPSMREVSLITVINSLQNMSDEDFDAKAAKAGLVKSATEKYKDSDGLYKYKDVYVSISKEECLERVIQTALNSILRDKIEDFFYENKPSRNSSGKVNEALQNAVLASDKELAREFESFPRESEERPLTPDEIQRKEELINKLYNRVSDFYYNHTYVMSQFIQLMATDIAYYKDPTKFKGSVDFAKRWKEVYGAGMKMNTNSKFGKKIERNIILADRVRRSRSYNVLDGVLQRAVDDGRILDVEKDAVLDKFKFITGTDAQAFRSLTSYRDIMDMIGRNSDDIARAIDNLRNDRWNMEDFYTVFNTLKPFSFGPEDQDSGIDDIHMRTMVQHKNSEAVLLAIYATLVGSDESDLNYSARLKGINRAMEDIKLRGNDGKGEVLTYVNGEEMRAIDVMQYQSAVKVGAHGIVDINYSRDALKKAQEDGRIPVNNKELSDKIYKLLKAEKKDIMSYDSYYDIEEKLGNLLDSNKISFDEYEEAMDAFEPDENEVFEIIEKSIYKNGDKSLGYDNQILHKMPYAYYSIQQPTPDHYTDNNEATFGSQPRHIIMADLPDNFEVVINGRKYKNREELRNRYNGLLIANLIKCYENEIEPLFKNTGEKDRKTGKRKLAIEKLQEKLLEMIGNNPKYGKNMKDALQIIGSGDDAHFALPLNNITISKQLEELLTSLFKNAIHRQKISGGNAILAADIGYSKSLKIVGERDENDKLIPGGKIEGIECYLPAHLSAMYKPYLVDKKDKYGNVITDADGNPIQILDIEKLKEAGLDKAIGYRIPTEGLYSIMPLIVKGFLPQQSGSSIVVAQEVTTLTGSDNDVDKMYLMMKAATNDLQAIGTPSDGEQLHPLEMSKFQRDNELIDIFYAVTTHPQMSHLWTHPGNYDNLKLNEKRLRILKDWNLRNIFKQNANLNTDEELIEKLTGELSQKEYNELYRKVMKVPADKKVEDKTIDDICIDFTNNFVKPLSPVYPDTFIEMHQMYMAGVAEKGIFANNTLDHAKVQWANVRINPSFTFNFEGHVIDKLDERYIEKKRGSKVYRHYISADCAECSAAAVDNGKDPVLNGLNSNKQTATFFGFLLRLGLGIEGASLLLAQPAVDWSIKNYGVVDYNGNLKGRLKKMKKWLISHNVNESDFNWRTHEFSTQEWYKNIVGERLDSLLKKGSDKDTVERIKSLYMTYSLIQNLKDMNSAFQEPRNILHYDSPNHAADTAMGGVIEQIKAVEEVNERKNAPDYERYFFGDDQLIVYNIEEKTPEKKEKPKKGASAKDILREQSPTYRLYNSLMGSELPVTQAFYTLGIEKVRKEFGSQFAFGRDEMQRLTDKMWKYMKSMYIKNPEDRKKIIGKMYSDWVVYRLSKTKLFGDDSNMTFDQKRQYYLYDYPRKFLKEKQRLNELNDIDAVRRMSVRNGMIIMDRNGKTTVTMRDFITDSFDSLLQNENPEAQKMAEDLFMYTYYLNGFEFSYMSFGNMLGTEFQRAFPEYIKALSDMNTEPITDEDMDNFFEQFIIKRNSMKLIRQITYKTNSLKASALQHGYHDTGYNVDWYGGIDEVPLYVNNVTYSGGKLKSELLRFSPEQTELIGTVVYIPVRMNTSLHYNAAQTVDEMMDVVYDQDKIDANRKTGVKRRNKKSVNYDKYQSNKSHDETSNERDGNTNEPASNGVPNVTVSPSALNSKEDDDVVMDNKNMDRAVGSSTDTEDTNEERIEENDAFLQRNKKAQQAIGKEEDDDKDIKEAQKELEKNNNGKGLCINL